MVANINSNPHAASLLKVLDVLNFLIIALATDMSNIRQVPVAISHLMGIGTHLPYLKSMFPCLSHFVVKIDRPLYESRRFEFLFKIF